MRILKTAAELKAWRARQKGSVGFVPTMGDLHAGHLSLVRRAQAQTDGVLVSIFVNPIQFNNPQDFKKYHRDSSADLKQLRALDVTAVFLPTERELYGKDFQTYVTVEKVSQPLCGAFRPGHFKGVATVVLKLFNLAQCERAYFGLKDFQQCRVIAQMARDLDLPLQLVFCPTVREQDGLAMSSRNRRLSAEQRARAASIYAALQKTRAQARLRPRHFSKTLSETFTRHLQLEKGDRVEYFECVDLQTLQPLKSYSPRLLMAAAVWIGGVRLIDNLSVNEK